MMPQQTEASESQVPILWLESPEPERATGLIRISFWVIAVIAGFAQAWSQRFYLSQDGNNYLDIASAYLRGDLPNAINAYWSPLLSWMVAGLFRVIGPSGYWETTLLHLLNFVALLIGLRCFEFFVEGFLDFLKRVAKSDEPALLNEPCWWLLSYGLFFSTSLFVITLGPTTPDIWVCAISYLATGILLRIAMRPRTTRYFAALGFVLGLGYLAKSFYFPLSFVFLFVAWLVSRGSAKNLARVLVSLLVFAVVAGPFVFEISKAKNRFTFGDAGKLTYTMFVNPLVQALFWQGDEQSGVPRHSTRKILSSPRVFEFAAPVGGSYPPSYDLSYWLDGSKAHFNLRGQLRIARQSIGTFFLIFLAQIEFAAGVCVLVFYQSRRREGLLRLAQLWPLWLPAAVACLAYSAVLVENRYVAPFLVFLWLGVFAGAGDCSSRSSRRVATAVVLGMLSITGIKTVKYFFSDLGAMAHQENVYWEVAQNLHKLGIQPGDRVAIIAGNAVAHWARLGEVKIVAELPTGDDAIFWSADPATQETVFAAFASTGSRVVVVKDPPLGETRDNWSQLGDTPYYAHLLPENRKSN